MVRSTRHARVTIAIVLPALLAGLVARATPSPISVEAGQHFNQGSEAFRRGDYPTAGEEFDRAYALAPHPDALWNAAQAWERSQELVRAANRYAEYLELAPASAPDRDRATAALARLAPRLGRIEVHLGADATAGSAAPVASIDGEPARPGSNFVYPGAHEVTFRSGTTSRRQPVFVQAGMVESVALLEDVARPRSSAPLAPSAMFPAPVGVGGEDRASSSGVPRWVVFAGGGATAIALGVTVWSGIDTLSAKSTFLTDPTQQTLQDGRDRQLRTNVLIAVTAGLGAATLASAFFVRWRSRGGSVALGLGPRLGLAISY
jgi:hypothetical protein